MENDIRDMVISHDRMIEHVSNAISGIQSENERILIKLDAIFEVSASHNVLSEKVQNIGENQRDGFERRDSRLNKIEDVQTGEGCQNVKASIAMAKKNITDISKVDTKLETEVKRINRELKSFVSGTVVRWALPIIVGSFMSYAAVANAERDSLDASLDENSLDIREFKTGIKSIKKTTERTEASLIEIHNAITEDANKQHSDLSKLTDRVKKIEDFIDRK